MTHVIYLNRGPNWTGLGIDRRGNRSGRPENGNGLKSSEGPPLALRPNVPFRGRCHCEWNEVERGNLGPQEWIIVNR